MQATNCSRSPKSLTLSASPWPPCATDGHLGTGPHSFRPVCATGQRVTAWLKEPKPRDPTHRSPRHVSGSAELRPAPFYSPVPAEGLCR